jgi:predicted metal-binding protein
VLPFLEEPDREVFEYETPSRVVSIEKMQETVPIEVIPVDCERVMGLCDGSCPNYGRKWSCPPYSPSFAKFSKGYRTARVICYRMVLEPYVELKPHSALRAANATLKAMIDGELRTHVKLGKGVAGSGSCRACNPCGAKQEKKCKKPRRRVYSLEAMGVDVSQLVRETFGFDLLWLPRGGELPEYTCVVGATLSR